MEKIELEIILDRSEKKYSFGEKIQGKVKAVIYEELQCDALNIILCIQGIGILSESKKPPKRSRLVYKDDRARKTLYQGLWSPGRYSYPFEVDAPQGPHTYAGSRISLDWRLKAEARTPTGESIVSETEVTIIPGDTIPEDSTQTSSPELVRTELPKGSIGCLSFAVVLFLAGLLSSVLAFQSGNDSLFGFVVLFAIVGLGLILFNIYFFMIAERVHMAEVKLASSIVSPGDIIPCSVTFQVNKPTKLKEVRAILLCREESGNVGIRASERTYQNVVYERRHELQLPVKLVPANVPIHVSGEIPVPSDAAPSFTLASELGRGIRLKWVAEFRIEMKWWPDWLDREEIIVRGIRPRV